MQTHTTLELPDKIAAGLASGKLVRMGGVIRKDTGPIVRHLREASLNPQALGDVKYGGLNRQSIPSQGIYSRLETGIIIKEPIFWG